MREYEPYWIAVRDGKTILIKVPPLEYPRVKKAIIKEKNIDVVYAISIGDGLSKPKLSFSYDIQAWTLTVKLNKATGLQLSDLV